jgi:hypothetical protein
MPKVAPHPKRSPAILALDTSCRTGWAHSDGSSGVVLLPGRETGDSNGERFDAFYDWLGKTVEAHETRFIVYEHGSHKRGAAPMQIGIGLPCILQLFAYRNKIAVKGVGTSAIKSHATGNGNAPKSWMIDAALKQFPTVNFVQNKKSYKGIDDNHVDALWLLHLAIGEVDW